MSPTDTHYLVAALLDVFFAVGSLVAYKMDLGTKDRLLAWLSRLSFALSCAGATFCIGGCIFLAALEGHRCRTRALSCRSSAAVSTFREHFFHALR
jgi:hypothetical protein